MAGTPDCLWRGIRHLVGLDVVCWSRATTGCMTHFRVPRLGAHNTHQQLRAELLRALEPLLFESAELEPEAKRNPQTHLSLQLQRQHAVACSSATRAIFGDGLAVLNQSIRRSGHYRWELRRFEYGGHLALLGPASVRRLSASTFYDRLVFGGGLSHRAHPVAANGRFVWTPSGGPGATAVCRAPWPQDN